MVEHSSKDTVVARLTDVAIEGLESIGIEVSRDALSNALSETAISHIASWDNLEGHSYGQVTMREGGRGGGTSFKPANAILDLRRIAETGSEIVLAANVPAPWMTVLAAVVILGRAQGLLTQNVDEEAASILWAAWQQVDDRGASPKADLRSRAEVERQNYGMLPLSDSGYQDAIQRLVGIGAIRHRPEEASVWLVESVVVGIA